jgi:CheY-like chemotaxis protein
VVEDGIELMAYLTERSRSEAIGLPALILLDLKMPRKDGREDLLEIKAIRTKPKTSCDSRKKT